MRVEADRTKCVASGQCVVQAPEVFGQNDDDGTVVLLRPNPGTVRLDALLEAQALCPSSAITVVREP